MKHDLLDTFAAAALTGILLRQTGPTTAQAATEAYTYAAAMLREREGWIQRQAKREANEVSDAEAPFFPKTNHSSQTEKPEGS